jgi:hypothetical protein
MSKINLNIDFFIFLYVLFTLYVFLLQPTMNNTFF